MSIMLITGANRGIGRETARQLVEQGHTVWIGSRDAERGRIAADELGARFVQIDTVDDESVAAAFETVGRAGGLDVLVNCAGVMAPQVEAVDITGPMAATVFDTNVIGYVRTIHAALPLLRRSANPVIVNISSALGSFWAVTNPERRQSRWPFVIYGASKAAVSMLTVQYAKALPEVKVNAVEPGYTATDFTGHAEDAQDVRIAGETVARMATIGPDGPTGTFSEQGGVPLAW